MPLLLAGLCASIVGLLAVEGAIWAFADDGSIVVAAFDIVMITLLVTSMKPTANDRSKLRAFSAIVGLITFVSEAIAWPRDFSNTFMLADFVIQVALVTACAALFMTFRSSSVSRWYEASGQQGVRRKMSTGSEMKDTADAIGELVAFFLPHCADQSTLTELKIMASDAKQWREAHKLFSRIRGKKLKANDANDRRLQCQYSFEELCAKILYNIADHREGFSSAYLPPFDEDSPLYVVPAAVILSQELGIEGFPFDSVKQRIDVAGSADVIA